MTSPCTPLSLFQTFDTSAYLPSWAIDNELDADKTNNAFDHLEFFNQKHQNQITNDSLNIFTNIQGQNNIENFNLTTKPSVEKKNGFYINTNYPCENNQFNSNSVDNLLQQPQQPFYKNNSYLKNPDDSKKNQEAQLNYGKPQSLKTITHNIHAQNTKQNAKNADDSYIFSKVISTLQNSSELQQLSNTPGDVLPLNQLKFKIKKQTGNRSKKDIKGLSTRNLCKVFVGGVGQATVEKTIRNHFSQYGEIIHCIIITHRKSGKSRRFGFITYSDEESALRAIGSKHKIDDVLVECRQALSKDEAQEMVLHDSLYIPTKIFVGGISDTVDETAFKQFFSKFGEIVDVTLAYDKNNHRPRGFGFIVFGSFNAAQAAVGKHSLYGKIVEAKHAVPRALSARGKNFDSNYKSETQGNYKLQQQFYSPQTSKDCFNPYNRVSNNHLSQYEHFTNFNSKLPQNFQSKNYQQYQSPMKNNSQNFNLNDYLQYSNQYDNTRYPKINNGTMYRQQQGERSQQFFKNNIYTNSLSENLNDFVTASIDEPQSKNAFSSLLWGSNIQSTPFFTKSQSTTDKLPIDQNMPWSCYELPSNTYNQPDRLVCHPMSSTNKQKENVSKQPHFDTSLSTLDSKNNLNYIDKFNLSFDEKGIYQFENSY